MIQSSKYVATHGPKTNLTTLNLQLILTSRLNDFMFVPLVDKESCRKLVEAVQPLANGYKKSSHLITQSLTVLFGGGNVVYVFSNCEFLANFLRISQHENNLSLQCCGMISLY